MYFVHLRQKLVYKNIEVYVIGFWTVNPTEVGNTLLADWILLQLVYFSLSTNIL